MTWMNTMPYLCMAIFSSNEEVPNVARAPGTHEEANHVSMAVLAGKEHLRPTDVTIFRDHSQVCSVLDEQLYDFGMVVKSGHL